MTIVFEVTEEGNLHGLHTDTIDLFAVGRVTNVRKASNIEFNENIQKWEVCSLDGKVLHTNRNRDAAIDWEIINFSPNGPYYNE